MLLWRALADPRCAQFPPWQPLNPPYQVNSARKTSMIASYFEEAFATTAGITVIPEDKQRVMRHH